MYLYFKPGEGIGLNIEDIFQKTIEEYDMIQNGDGIVVGVSGGPDSIALLHLLYRFGERYNLRLVCAHLNHRFRPGDAEKDARFVEDFCRERGIPCVAETVDVPRMAAREGLSPEQAGRRARYHLFNRVMREKGFNKIAVAHNLDDQVETVLMRLIRGSGVAGLGGIKPVRGSIIRPLLEVSRSLIEEYCAKNELGPVTDKTNFMPVYFRNRIRLELLPYLRDKYNNNIDRAILDMANILREEDDCLGRVAGEKFLELASGIGTDRLEFCIKDLSGLHTALRRRVLRKGVEHLLGDVDNLELTHIRQVCGLLEAGKTGKRLNLPRGLVAGVEYGRFFIARGEPEKGSIKGTYTLTVPGRTHIPEIGVAIDAFVVDVDTYLEERNEADDSLAFLDFEKVGRNLAVTGRKEGDRFLPLGMGGTKKLKDFFIDAKVPKGSRGLIPIVRNKMGIVWVAGYRIDERFKVSKDTGQVLRIELLHLSIGEE